MRLEQFTSRQLPEGKLHCFFRSGTGQVAPQLGDDVIHRREAVAMLPDQGSSPVEAVGLVVAPVVDEGLLLELDYLDAFRPSQRHSDEAGHYQSS
jgi:hypothetical protein